MAATIRRLFGFSTDAVAGGTDYDTLLAGAVPDAAVFWPVTGGTLDRNEERIDRNDEIRGRRAASPPRSFRARPVLTVPARAYLSLVAVALKKTLGGTDTITGAMSPYTHTLAVLGYGSTQLPAVNAQLVRDDLNHKVAGATFNRTTLTFPLDGEGTIECELHGKYFKNDVAAPPSATFTGESPDPLMLRDAQMTIDGAGSPVQDLTGFTFAFVNNLTPKWYAKRNVVTQSLGTPTQVRKVHFPSENKLQAAQDVTYSMSFGNVSAAQELALTYSQVQKLVFEVAGPPITGGTEILRITIFGGVHTGGGPEAASARDDITQSHDGGAFYSDADAADIKVEVVSSQSAAYA